MGPERLQALLEAVAAGLVPPAAAADQLASLPFADLGDLRIDHHREIRTGEPEVVYAAGKTPEQCARAITELLRGSDGPVLATRATPAHAAAIMGAVPDAQHDPVGRVVVARAVPQGLSGLVAVLAAGTSDLPVARECTSVLAAFGAKADLVCDVGVAGLHRVLAERALLGTADVVVAVAGMEGALPTIVAGLTSVPVIAVPTSVGYGAAFSGLAALLAMLNSCAHGVVVTNIDNGFGAAMMVLRILRLLERHSSP
ncbi:MAG: nickel pincer cofactor biosynthesis protein LarB [Nitriliruptorales bacterium]